MKYALYAFLEKEPRVFFIRTGQPAARPVQWTVERHAGIDPTPTQEKLLIEEIAGFHYDADVSNIALAQFAAAYSLIAQPGIYVDQGYGQVVKSLAEIIGMF